MRTNRSSRYLLVLWLGLSLLLAQTLGIHLHTEHAHHDEAVTNHHVDSYHGLMSHADDADHHASIIGIGSDTLSKERLNNSLFLARYRRAPVSANKIGLFSL